MEYQVFTKEQFVEWLFEEHQQERPITRLTLHYLWRKKGNKWLGDKSVEGLTKYYKNQKKEFAFHFAVAGDKIWYCLDIEKRPFHTGKFNIGSIDIEADAVIGHRKPTEQTWDTFLFVIRKLMQKFKLDPNQVYLHSEVDKKAKNCPDIESKDWLLGELIEDEDKALPFEDLEDLDDFDELEEEVENYGFDTKHDYY
jgi:hypothetical protein